MGQKPKILVIVGPTASGKSDLAVTLAKRFNGEVVSADSRQVYRGLDIGTGKITMSEMKGIPHHLLDVASPMRTYSVARYQRNAVKAVAGILKRGKLPIICGGTGLYIDALVDGVVLPEVKPDAKLRKELVAMSTEALFARLKKLDQTRAHNIDQHNPRRLIRAIEIATAIGEVPEVKKIERYDPLFIGISVPNDELAKRIHSRLQKRMKQGMVAEVKNLHKNGLSWKRMEDLGLEYRYLAQHLEGKISKKEMLALLETAIIQYAKRQMTWFKRNTRIHWVAQDRSDAVLPLTQEFLL